MGWTQVGEFEVTPTTTEVVVGPVSVPAAGGLEVRIKQTAPTPFRWGFGLLSFRSNYGLELGTIKVWPRLEVSSYLLGAGLTADDTEGVLIFEPRSYGLRWVLAGFPLGLVVWAWIASDLPADRFEAPGFTTAAGSVLGFVRSGRFGRLLFGP